MNNRDVSVTCTGTEGSTLGALGYAVITTSAGDESLMLQNGGEKMPPFRHLAPVLGSSHRTFSASDHSIEG